MRKTAFVLAVFCILTLGCREKQPVVVHIYRDRTSLAGPELDRRFYELSRRTISLSSGRRTVITTAESQNYKQMLRDRIGKERLPELIVLNSPTDAAVNPIIERESARAVNICNAARTCPAVVPALIPSWVTDSEEVEAAQVVLKALLSTNPIDRPGATP